MHSRNNNLELFYALAIADIKARYYSSLWGLVFFLFKPIFYFVIIFTVFSYFFKTPTGLPPLSLFLGLILWNFFVESSVVGLNAFVSKAPIIRKIRLPKIIVVLSATVSPFITLLLNMLILGVFSLDGDPSFRSATLLIPLYLIALYFFTLGISLFTSVIRAGFKNAGEVWETILLILFWLSPIIYPLANIPDKFRLLFYLNPVGQIIEYSRNIFWEQQMPTVNENLLLAGTIATVCALGYLFFNKFSQQVAELL